MASKEVKKLIKEAKRQGVRVVDGGKHYKLYMADGKTMVTVAKTPSDQRWLKNTIARMKRGGFKW